MGHDLSVQFRYLMKWRSPQKKVAVVFPTAGSESRIWMVNFLSVLFWDLIPHSKVNKLFFWSTKHGSTMGALSLHCPLTASPLGDHTQGASGSGRYLYAEMSAPCGPTSWTSTPMLPCGLFFVAPSTANPFCFHLQIKLHCSVRSLVYPCRICTHFSQIMNCCKTFCGQKLAHKVREADISHTSKTPIISSFHI